MHLQTIGAPIQLSMLMDIRWNIGDIVRKLRLQHGWTQTKLGQKAGGLNKATIVALERGSGDTKQSTVDAVAKAFGLKVAELYALIPTAESKETQRATRPSDVPPGERFPGERAHKR